MLSMASHRMMKVAGLGALAKERPCRVIGAWLLLLRAINACFGVSRRQGLSLATAKLPARPIIAQAWASEISSRLQMTRALWPAGEMFSRRVKAPRGLVIYRRLFQWRAARRRLSTAIRHCRGAGWASMIFEGALWHRRQGAWR